MRYSYQMSDKVLQGGVNTIARCSRPVYRRSVSVSEDKDKTPRQGIKTSLKRRYSDSESLDRGAKKPKMNAKQQEIVEAVQTNMKADMREIMTEVIQDQLGKRLDKMDTDMKAMGTRLDKIEEQNTEESREQLANQIEDKVCKRMDSKMNVSVTLYLKQQISDSERNLIITGWQGTDGKTPQEHTIELAKKIEIPEAKINSMHIVKSYRLGKKKEEATREGRPLFASFNNIGSRNLFFEHARNLPKGSRIDIDVPAIYRPGHKKLQEEAKRQRDFLELKTRIAFNGTNLTLFARKQKEEAWGIVKEFTPTIEMLQKAINKNSTTAETVGKKPHTPSAEETEKASKLIRIFNMPETAVGDVHATLGKVLSASMKKKLRNVLVRKSVLYIQCEDKKAAKEICKTCSESKLEYEGRKLEFSTM